MEAGDAIAPIGTLLIGGPAIFAFLKWLLERNLKAFEDKIDSLERRLDAIEKTRAAEQTVSAVDKANAQNSANTILQTVSSLDGQFKEMTRQNEAAREKQADFYRKELEKTERSMRDDLQKIQASVILGPATRRQTRTRGK